MKQTKENIIKQLDKLCFNCLLLAVIGVSAALVLLSNLITEKKNN